MIVPGTRLRYRSLAGSLYDAVMVRNTFNRRRAVIDVVVPGVMDPYRLNYVNWSDMPTLQKHTAWPEEAGSGEVDH